MYIGFNEKEVEKLIEAIIKQYNSLHAIISDQWGPLKSTLRNNWVGPDEQDFEREFVNRINDLYTKSYNLAKATNENIEIILENWIKFQKKNTIDGKTASGAKYETTSIGSWFSSLFSSSSGPKLKKDDSIVTFQAMTITANMNRGLKNSNSATLIHNAVASYVKNIQSKCNQLYDTINSYVKKAFFGKQSTALQKYLDAVASSLGVLMTSVKDLDNALAKLAGSAYVSTDESTVKTVSSYSNKAQSQSNLSGKRWS